MFSSDQASRLAGVTYRQMDYWTRMGLIRPIEGEIPGTDRGRGYGARTSAATPGSGGCRKYDIEELFVLCVVAELMRLKAGTDCAGRVAEQLRMLSAQPHAAASPVGGRIFIDVDGFIVSAPDSGAYVIDLDVIRVKLDERAAALAAA